MMSPHVQRFCQAVWRARERGQLPSAMVLSRSLAVAVAADVLAGESYDPYEDRRVEWAQAVIKARTWLRPDLRPEADANLEFLVAAMLGEQGVLVLTGKDYAAGEARVEVGDADSCMSTLNPQLSTSFP